MSDLSADRAAEQAHLDLVYRRLDQLVEAAQQQLAAVRRTGSVGTPQARSERDAFATTLEHRIAQLRAVQDRLVFGRLDLRSGERHHIGRVGISDEHQDKLLVDWRAPVAAPFYQATPAAPGDVVRRRHLTTSGREVVHLDDEVLDLSAISDTERATLQGEGALMAAVTAPRTGRMGDIVATIQGEQDRIVRDELAGVLVVQGGPGTGKTAVALHRAAYLLFTYRRRLERSGVLVVGPGPLFLRYIEQVLPSLGESGVVMATPGTLFPGVEAERDDADDVARVKGDLRMVQVLEQAVRDRQRLPDADLELRVGSRTLVLTRSAVGRSAGPRPLHRRAAQRRTRHLRQGPAAPPRGPARRAAAPAAHRRPAPGARRRPARLPRRAGQPQPAVDAVAAAALPHRPVRGRQPARLGGAHPDGRPSATCCARERGAPWTVHDVPLLDELAELMGDDGEAARAEDRRRAAELAGELDYARGVLQMTRLENPVVSAEMLAEQFAALGPDAERRRARGGRPHLGVRPPHRRRGAGAHADDVAPAGSSGARAARGRWSVTWPSAARPRARRRGRRCWSRSPRGAGASVSSA